MILVTVGSQKFQFNRLLKEIDELIENGEIKESVFAQIGVSDYRPKNYKYIDFLTQDELEKKIGECNLLITHAGTGLIINAVKKDKKVIAAPRLAKYGEHVDDHQIQIIKEFKKLGFIEDLFDMKKLGEKINEVRKKEYKPYKSNTKEIIKSIKEFITE